MEFTGYIYFPKLADDRIDDFVESLISTGVRITHLGKSDPPKKWKGTTEEAADIITLGKDLTRWTFGRDEEKGVDFTIALHADPRWEHNTFSISGKDKHEVKDVVEATSIALSAFIGFVGELGGGKNQKWEILHISAECPRSLALKINGADIE